ncbi:hypothetical protein Z946_1202 [Sulfitobacter noctilucicola]|uniref:Uncharacterized protein n=1 Tax=Sulfitobacter noctilucicola TaxID=1342301 RepID=A0A7W6M7Z1_9RHOB|nr:hypothetical protein Z946_1202 [Sulfitobacter noctilucicola]MBB4173121.1 hypothetical protein [Sulfitobacter noctilucicola]
MKTLRVVDRAALELCMRQKETVGGFRPVRPNRPKETIMRGIIYLVGLVVIVLAIVQFVL